MSRRATRSFVNDDGLILRRAIRCARAGDRGLTTNRYPLGQANTGSPDECSSGERNRVAVMRVCIMDCLHIRRRAVGMVNCRPRVRGKSNAHKQGSEKRLGSVQSCGLSVILPIRRVRCYQDNS